MCIAYLAFMFVIVQPFLVPRRSSGITLWPFIVVRKKEQKHNTTLLNHERIHIRQQLELLIIPFYIWYGIEFLIRLVSLKNWDKAYKAIAFEKEAYSNELDLEYLKQRPFWRFLGYF